MFGLRPLRPSRLAHNKLVNHQILVEILKRNEYMVSSVIRLITQLGPDVGNIARPSCSGAESTMSFSKLGYLFKA